MTKDSPDNVSPTAVSPNKVSPSTDSSNTRSSNTVSTAKQLPRLRVTGTWRNVFDSLASVPLLQLLPLWLIDRRWFAGKAKVILSTTIKDLLPLAGGQGDEQVELLLVEVQYADHTADIYVIPVAFAIGGRAIRLVDEQSPSILAALDVVNDATGESSVSGVLYDAFGDEACGQLLLELIGNTQERAGRVGRLAGSPLRGFAQLRGPSTDHLPVRSLQAEQSNSAIVYGDRLLLKLFRRLENGTNLDLELGRFLTDTARFPQTPPVAGSADYQEPSGQHSTVAILQAFVPNQGDAWNYTLKNASLFFQGLRSSHPSAPPFAGDLPARGVVAAAVEPLPPIARELCGAYLNAAALLGQRTAEMHVALATNSEDPEFAPEALSLDYQQTFHRELCAGVSPILQLLRRKLHELPADIQDDAQRLLQLEGEISARFDRIADRQLSGSRIRCHGDYHLGQVLFTGQDFMIIDFEGEPSRPLSERRGKRAPLRDVAGMMRSFDYASQCVYLNEIVGSVPETDLSIYQGWAGFWSQWISTQFLSAYLQTTARAPFATQGAADIQTLLEVFLLEKAVYELAYELNNRPAWIRVPLGGILRILNA